MMLHALRLSGLVLSLIAAAAAGAQAQPLPPGQAETAAAANPPENQLITTRVTQAFNAWQRGSIDRKQYTGPAGGTYDDAVLRVVTPDLVAIGTVQSATYRTTSLLLGDLFYRYEIVGSAGTISVLYVLDQSGKVDGITFTPQIFRPAAMPTP